MAQKEDFRASLLYKFPKRVKKQDRGAKHAIRRVSDTNSFPFRPPLTSDICPILQQVNNSHFK